jgi:hypothetical protein
MSRAVLQNRSYLSIGGEIVGTSAAPWRDMVRPTLDEMYYDPMKARPTRNPPSAWLRLD